MLALLVSDRVMKGSLTDSPDSRQRVEAAEAGVSVDQLRDRSPLGDHVERSEGRKYEYTPPEPRQHQNQREAQRAPEQICAGVAHHSLCACIQAVYRQRGKD